MTPDDALITVRLARALWSVALRPGQRDQIRSRMMRPKPGDLVAEISPRLGGALDPDSFGYLIAMSGADLSAGHVDAWIIEPLTAPGKRQTWRNAEFAAIPLHPLEEWLSS